MNKKHIWDMAMGLSCVDGGNPSDELIILANKSIEGQVNDKEIESILIKHYVSSTFNIKLVCHELERDLVATRIVNLLNKPFKLTSDTLMTINRFLFQGIYTQCGRYRFTNIRKWEEILDGDTVTYAPYQKISEYIEYDLIDERKLNYKLMTPEQKRYHLLEITSRLWQIHPFREGNTRTVAVFIMMYMKSLGININMEVFKNNTLYFRNALVRYNYQSDTVDSEVKYLDSFFENLMGGNNTLDNDELHIQTVKKK